MKESDYTMRDITTTSAYKVSFITTSLFSASLSRNYNCGPKWQWQNHLAIK